ncbi:MAG: S-methyl-5'-thioadenosine phosphorylase [Methanomassiliicoccales archaeon]|jgi:5'-methylthioadenosine phosphorylase|nr:S-methyl-5'-thioadenosine phosphorylase [Methanomassiliicoccales archaeon]
MDRVRIAIIGGTGVYEEGLFKIKKSVKLNTPYGPPSDDIQIGELGETKVAFLSRHGKNHIYPPHRVNYRANIWALKELGVERVISPCAVGSLKEDYRPGEIVIVDQFIDFTKRRDYTFFDGAKTIHIGAADPFCPELRQLFIEQAMKEKILFKPSGTYICIEGPRFSTRAESRMFRNFADIIGMTLVPECQLARELEMCYVSLAMITDYDVWAEKPVDTATVLRTMNENIDKIRRLIIRTLPLIPKKREKCECPKTLELAGT